MCKVGGYYAHERSRVSRLLYAADFTGHGSAARRGGPLHCGALRRLLDALCPARPGVSGLFRPAGALPALLPDGGGSGHAAVRAFCRARPAAAFRTQAGAAFAAGAGPAALLLLDVVWPRRASPPILSATE